MPEHLRALVVILLLATVVFASARAPACALAIKPADFARRRNLWILLTLTVFLAHNFWIYIIVAAVLLLFAVPRESNRLALYFFVLFAVPTIPGDIGGLGVVNYFFSIDYLRLLALLVLLPAYFSLRSRPGSAPFGRLLPDKLLAAYLVLQFLLMLTVSTFTNTLRMGAFYAFIDIFLPYYVASRGLRNLAEFRDALMSFVVAVLVLSLIAAVEFAWHWLLYAPLQGALDMYWGYGNYLARGETLRAVATSGQSIVLGYLMVVALGLFLYLRTSVSNSLAWKLGFCALLVGLIAPVSRGPWMGAGAMFVIFAALGPSPGKVLLSLGALGLLAIPLLMVMPGGSEIIDYLPFVGTVDASNVTYRQRLLQISSQVILQHPFFGAFDYFYSPAMQELKQGAAGFIDLVNTYIAVALASGLVGLSLFVGFFIAVGTGMFKAFLKARDHDEETRLLGRALLSTLAAILIIIFTVSSITVIPVVYWAVAGVGVAYARMLALENAPQGAPASARPARLQPAGLRVAYVKGR